MGAVVDFVKMQALGNDFVVVDERVSVDRELVRALCDRRFGVGADGLLRVTSPSKGTVRMEYWNADGSDAEMCGNGLRCVARFAFDRGLVDGREFEVITPVGVRRVRVGDSDVTVDLGRAVVGDFVDVDHRSYTTVSVGNPHAVGFGFDLDEVDVRGIGESMQRHDAFPDGVNVEFVDVIARNHLSMRVWERGVGETLACGSGMVAVAAAAHHRNAADPEVTIDVPGGTAHVRIETDAAWLTGPAEFVYEGRWLSESS